MNLNTFLYATDKFIELEPTIDHVKEDISFWGIRYVYLDGSKDRFPIDILAKRVMELVKSKHFEYSNQERIAGKKIAAKIDKIYESNDDRLERKWFITQYLCYFIDSLRNGGYHIGFHWNDGRDNKVFDYYTNQQYQEEFSSNPDNRLSKWWGDGEVGRIRLYRKTQ